MTRLALLLLSTLPLAGCYLDSRDKTDAEREALPVAPAIARAMAAEVVPVVVPECVSDEFRVHRCVGGRINPW